MTDITRDYILKERTTALGDPEWQAFCDLALTGLAVKMAELGLVSEVGRKFWGHNLPDADERRHVKQFMEALNEAITAYAKVKT